MRWTRRVWMTLAAISGFVAVAAGAFAAHGLTDRASDVMHVDGLVNCHVHGGILYACVEKTIGFVHSVHVLRAACHLAR